MNNTYMQILTGTLNKKSDILDQLIQLTLIQKEIVTTVPLDWNQFEQSINKKEIQIEQLNQLDDGFDLVYHRLKEELQINKGLYKDEIVKLQELIKQVTEKSMELQVLEKENKKLIEVAFANKKSYIRNLKKSSQTVSQYYKNMPNQHQGQSYFLDKKN